MAALARVQSATLLGISALPVDVEVDLQDGLPSFSTVGLPDESVRESRDRVRSALANSGYAFPSGRVTVNLSPADMRKEGSGFDLAIAVGLLAVEGKVPPLEGRGYLIVGELSLDGTLKGVRGVLPMAMAAREARCAGMIVPRGNAREAALVEGVKVFPASSLGEAAAFLGGEALIEPMPAEGKQGAIGAVGEDLADVRGQESAKRALEVAAAGGHNIMLFGPPGTGKTMLARRFPSILPPMSVEESLETTRILSIAGMLSPESPLVRRRPFRSPHHTVSYAGMAGGGARPRPGEVSLAHNGVLFLDELPEFPRRVLEVLRQPMEERAVTISRAAVSMRYPANFMLVAAMNPCPCGYMGSGQRRCVCSPTQVMRYRGRVSGPLLDRIDLQVEVPALRYEEFARGDGGDSSGVVSRRVAAARERQTRRFEGEGIACNAAMGPAQLRRHCSLQSDGEEMLREAVDKLGFSTRAVARVLKVARTVADLAGSGGIGTEHFAEAVQYRCLDRLE